MITEADFALGISSPTWYGGWPDINRRIRGYGTVTQTKVQNRTRRGDAPKPPDVVFANDQWVVTRDGLDCPRHGYFIHAERLGSQEDGLLEWPLRMVTKTWVKPESFLQAFAVACRFHGVRADKDLMVRSYAAARKQATRYNDLWPVAAAKVYPEKAPEWASGRRLSYSPDELIEISREVDRMIQAEEQHHRYGPV
jgi:hypothetical protein